MKHLSHDSGSLTDGHLWEINVELCRKRESKRVFPPHSILLRNSAGEPLGSSAPHVTAIVLWFLSVMLETHPSIRAVQRCFVRSNSISEFLHRTHHISKQTPGQCALRCMHKSQKHAQHARSVGTSPPLTAFTLGGFNNKKHEWDSAIYSKINTKTHESCSSCPILSPKRHSSALHTSNI